MMKTKTAMLMRHQVFISSSFTDYFFLIQLKVKESTLQNKKFSITFLSDPQIWLVQWILCQWMSSVLQQCNKMKERRQRRRMLKISCVICSSRSLLDFRLQVKFNKHHYYPHPKLCQLALKHPYPGVLLQFREPHHQV